MCVLNTKVAFIKTAGAACSAFRLVNTLSKLCIMSIAHGPTQFLIFLCDALMICLSTGLDVREVQFYMSAMETICIAGLMIGILATPHV